jgi:hypothetical protein
MSYTILRTLQNAVGNMNLDRSFWVSGPPVLLLPFWKSAQKRDIDKEGDDEIRSDGDQQL